MQCTGNLGCSPQEMRAAIIQRYPVVFSLCAVFSCFRNPLNSDMDYRIINMRMRSFFACVYTRTLGTPMSQHNILTRKNSQIFLCSRQGLNLWSLDLELMLYQMSHPATSGLLMSNTNQQHLGYKL